MLTGRSPRVARRPWLLFLVTLLGSLIAAPAAPPALAGARPGPPVEASVQAFLDAQPGPLKSYRDGDHSAAELIQSASLYYGLSPRVLLALLEATGGLLSTTPA